MNLDADARRKAFQEKQKRVREKLKKQSTDVQASGARVEDGPRPGDHTQNRAVR